MALPASLERGTLRTATGKRKRLPLARNVRAEGSAALPEGGGKLQGDTKHSWLDICAEAAICEDAERLAELAIQINAILRDEQQRLELEPKTPTAA